MADSQYLLHKWQSGMFNCSSDGKQPRERLDGIHSILSQVYTGRASKRIPQRAWADLTQKYMRQYAAIVDCSTSSGLNNFAEGALAACGTHAADSSHWKSSLSVDSIIKTDSFTHLQKTSQQNSSMKKLEGALHLLKQEEKLPHSKGPPLISTSASSAKFSTADVPLKGFHNQINKLPQEVHQEGDQRQNDAPFDVHDVSLKEKEDSWSQNKDFHDGRQEPNFQMFQRDNSNPGKNTSLVKPVQFHQTKTFPQQGLYSRSGSDTFSGAEWEGRGQPLGTGRGNTLAGEVAGLTRREADVGIWRKEPVKRKLPNSSGTGYQPAFQLHSLMTRPPADEEEKDGHGPNVGSFKTARQQLAINNQTKNGNQARNPSTSSYGTGRKVLGVTRNRRGINSKFVPPVINSEENNQQRYVMSLYLHSTSSARKSTNQVEGEPVDERLQNVDPKMVELIMNEIMDHGPPIQWDDIAGLEYAKKTIKEIVVWPMLRPDIFHGLRGPPKGLLLFGPPGTGKTLIGKCIASQSKSTFFSISASSLTSKWVGEGEKMVRALFSVARCYQPAVIFIDEIDSLLSQRSTDEHESSRRIKTEFLVQLDGATSSDDDRLLVVGATNRPQEIDEAARRRLVKRLYIPLPEASARKQIIINLLSQQGNHSLTEEEVNQICERTDGYSGADVANLCREAALGPIRSLHSGDIQHISADEVRGISYQDFLHAVESVRPSVSQNDLVVYLEWNKSYGSGKT
ncbi:Fidgetin-like protein 1 [Holothuria leucospilota]|uniref:Fidgetin-like protein 1 n=1 Tax=Holothuria leucospilota TaxID=206669 RepID=A0A9Q1BGA9_HOLLE|nr:Fidgetin-like protein 1 [Holothuria leucospilota]